MASWFKRAVLWQRLWLIASVGGIAAGVFWLPGVFEKANLQRLAEARARVVAEFDLPVCLPVRSTPYTNLAPVPEGAPCHDIYIWRRDVKEKLPLVMSNVLYPIDAHRREILVSGAAKGGGLMVLLSALAYAFFAFRARPRAQQQ